MTTFNPNLHNPESLASQLQRVYDHNPEILVVGSLGRSALYNALIGDPEYEYKMAGRQPVRNWSNGPADIDLINAARLERLVDEPFEFDTETLNGQVVNIHHDGFNWIVESVARDYKVGVFPQMMTPVVSQSVYGADCRTVPLCTHLELLGMGGDFIPQDLEAFGALMDVAELAPQVSMPNVYSSAFEELRRRNHICTTLGIEKKPTIKDYLSLGFRTKT